MTEIQNIYSKLYDKNSYNLDDRATDNFLNKVDVKKLSKLTRAELLGALKTFDRNKTPGNDGVTVEFYLAFCNWPLLEKCLVDSLNFSHEHGQLSNSQKQAMITLLEKKGKDKRYIENWRPISVINVEVKIASKALAKRLEPILPEIVHHNQNGFIKGKSIFDAVRTIDDKLELAEATKRSGILVAIDFEKAFDSLDHSFLFKVLEKFNLGPYRPAMD